MGKLTGNQKAIHSYIALTTTICHYLEDKLNQSQQDKWNTYDKEYQDSVNTYKRICEDNGFVPAALSNLDIPQLLEVCRTICGNSPFDRYFSVHPLDLYSKSLTPSDPNNYLTSLQ